MKRLSQQQQHKRTASNGAANVKETTAQAPMEDIPDEQGMQNEPRESPAAFRLAQKMSSELLQDPTPQFKA